MTTQIVLERAPRPRGIAFLWHPPEESYAGGFIAARRFFELQTAFRFLVIDSDATDIVASENVRVVRIPEKWSLSSRRALFGILRAANWSFHSLASLAVGLRHVRESDFLFVPTSEIPCATLPAFVLGVLFRKPLVLCNLNIEGQELWTLNRELHRRATAVLTISQALATGLRRQLKRVPIATYPIGTDDGSVARETVPTYDGIFVGRHVKEKGIFDLLEIWARCRRVHPHLRLAMVGPCEPAIRTELERRIAQLDLVDGVELLGPVSEEAKWRLYARSRLCVFPSYVEGWGIVPLEAHMSGIPVVAYKLPAYDENIVASPSAMLVPPRDIDAFADAVLAALDRPIDPEATTAWAKQYTWRHAVERQQTVVGEALTARRAG